MSPTRALVATLLVFIVADAAGQQPRPPAARKFPMIAGGLGLTVTPFEPDPANADEINSLAVGFDMQVVWWKRPTVGIRGAAGVEFFKGPVGSNGHPAGGSYGLSSIALALRTLPKSGQAHFGLDLGLSTTFESTYSYSYTSGNTIYVYPSIDLPLKAGPFVEASLRGGKLVGWLVTYRQFFSSTTATEGHLKRRILISLFAGK